MLIEHFGGDHVRKVVQIHTIFFGLLLLHLLHLLQRHVALMNRLFYARVRLGLRIAQV